MSTADPIPCPLCGEPVAHDYHHDGRRGYRQCNHCALVFVPPWSHLTPAAEKAIYDQHENTLDDPGYRRFLSRMAEPLLARLHTASRGLDFGCGPAPLLAQMLERAGHSMALYDRYYAPDSSVLAATYDFITATETIEHLREPGEVFAQWVDLLRPGGWLGVMTKRVIGRQAFARWHYKNDLTHIAFFSAASFEYLARRHGLVLEIVDKDVVLFCKPPAIPHGS